MSEISDRQGSCLCGAVQLQVAEASNSFDACHCDMCRKWGGGPLFTVECKPDTRFEGEENITVYDSSEWAERGFCKQCGSHLFYRLKHSGMYEIPMGLFDDTEGLEFKRQIFIDEKPSLYTFANSTQDLTGSEVFALYEPSPER